MLLKLEASRPQDLPDLSRMLGGADDAMLDEVRRVVDSYRDADRDDVENLIVMETLEYAAEQQQLDE